MVVASAAAPTLTLVETETQVLLDWVDAIGRSSQSTFAKAQALAQRLGAHYRANGLTQLGFWTPQFANSNIQPQQIFLEVFTPLEPIDPQLTPQTILFRHETVQLTQQGEFLWGVVAGMTPGRRDQFGSFYWLRHRCLETETVAIVGDCLGHSYPFGIYAPAELYDLESLQRDRQDRVYFSQGDRHANGVIHVQPPTHILQLHVGTATPAGTIAGLNRLYTDLAEKLIRQQPLDPWEANFIGYDAVQLLPIEPTVEWQGEHNFTKGFFQIAGWADHGLDPTTGAIADQPQAVEITLTKPDTENWGYDIVIFGSSAINPANLETLRPDELLDLIVTLHTFPTGPIQLILDIVYGHADNQAIGLLNSHFLKGPNMYGQDVNHQNPTVRAILLEMQRRKNQLGVDGIRIDGAQDFKFFNPLSGEVEYDDRYLSEMAEVVQTIQGNRRRLVTIYEDGRPWPAEGWETLSTYRDILAFKPDDFQWGPLIFAHNTPCLQNFWHQKWDRVQDVMTVGSHWITGCGNHDTLRRGTQVDTNAAINWQLGATLPEVIQQAYDNPAITLWTYGFSPGLPMDFINCTARSPWGFLRNTDDRYGVKVVAEEAKGFLAWQMLSETYAEPHVFPRLKALGFRELAQLQKFVTRLEKTVQETYYNLPHIVHLCRNVWPDATGHLSSTAAKSFNVKQLKAFAQAFMSDAHAFANVTHHRDRLDPVQTAYNLTLREFRRAHPWLRHNLQTSDTFAEQHCETHTVFYGQRISPDQLEQVVLVAHMGGDPVTLNLPDLLGLDLTTPDWKIAACSPQLACDRLPELDLTDSQAVLFWRSR